MFGGMTYHRVAFPSASCVMKVKLKHSAWRNGMCCVLKEDLKPSIYIICGNCISLCNR